MPKNSFFQFKQFTIHQDQCAMKVCTDACVLGAWVDVSAAKRVLDIGAGTGLLSLMLAQRNEGAKIEAVELDEKAFEQAVQNVDGSKFKDHIEVFHSAIQRYFPTGQYDCIISNPPFFQSDLRSPNASKNVAHHADSLSFLDLFAAVDRLITPEGSFHILLPVDESKVFRKMAEDLKWFLSKNLTLYHHSGKKPFREIMTLSKVELVDTGEINTELCIYEPDGKSYHSQFRELMKDYYLIF